MSNTTDPNKQHEPNLIYEALKDTNERTSVVIEPRAANTLINIRVIRLMIYRLVEGKLKEKNLKTCFQ